MPCARRRRRRGAVVVDALPAPTGATRGDGDRSASAVRVLNLRSRLEEQLKDPAILKEFAEDFGLKLVDRAGSWMLAKALIWLIERQLKPREGLYHWDQAVRAAKPDSPDPAQATFEGVDPTQPILLFLHGTGSSTRGSFGEFLEPGAADQWKELTSFFGDRIYALEHKTLSRSPIENALVVAERMPANANLYLVSHSRGGLIGDLLSLRGIDTRQIAAFTRHGEFDAADKYDRDRLSRPLGAAGEEEVQGAALRARRLPGARHAPGLGEHRPVPVGHHLSRRTDPVPEGLAPLRDRQARHARDRQAALGTRDAAWHRGDDPDLAARAPPERGQRRHRRRRSA